MYDHITITFPLRGSPVLHSKVHVSSNNHMLLFNFLAENNQNYQKRYRFSTISVHFCCIPSYITTDFWTNNVTFVQFYHSFAVTALKQPFTPRFWRPEKEDQVARIEDSRVISPWALGPRTLGPRTLCPESEKAKTFRTARFFMQKPSG